MTSDRDSVVVVSGGLDSVTLAHFVTKVQTRRPIMLTFNYGQRHDKEIQCARDNARVLDIPFHCIDLSFFGDMVKGVSSLIGASKQEVPDLDDVLGDPQPNTYVPNRNMIMLSIAAGFAEAQGVSDVFIGVQRHDTYGYWDTTDEFMARMNGVLNLNRKNRITFMAPFVDFDKTQEVRIGLAIGVDYSSTWSCYKGGDFACGTCPTCRERLTAFANVGLPDPISYAQ